MGMLEYMAKNKEGVTLQQIAEHLDVPKSSAFVILQTLLKMGYACPSRYNDKKYCLGIEAYSLGMSYVSDMDMVSVSSSFLEPIADKFKKTGFVGVLSGLDIVYVYKHVAEGVKLVSCDLGTRRPAHLTALGKAIMSTFDDKQLDKFIAKVKFAKLTENSIVSPENLRLEIEKIKEVGYSIDNRENDVMLTCSSAPIFDYTGKAIGAISLSDIYAGSEEAEQLGIEVKMCADHISKVLGYVKG